MIKINDSELRKFESDLKTFAERAYPFATKQTLNRSAFDAQKTAREGLSGRMTLRNRYTAQSIQVEQTRTLDVRRQAAVVGSTAGYMEDQEFGGVVAKRGKYGQVIPTSWSARQEGRRPRTRVPTAANALKNIRLKKRLKKRFNSRRQEAFLRALLAVNEGDKFVYIPGGEGGHAGIFRVWGRAKLRGRFTQVRMKMAYSLRRGPASLSANPWLAPAVKKTERRMPEFYKDALRFQLKRHGLFSGK